LNGNNYICLLNLGDVDRWLHRGTEAVPLYQRAWERAMSELEQNPRSGYTRAFVAYLAGRLRNRERSEQEIAQALVLSPDDNKVIRRAVLTYEMLGKRDQALELAARLTPRALAELERHPDLAEFCQDDRYKKLMTNGGGKIYGSL
jgi:serine/threonine-protein kinase